MYRPYSPDDKARSPSTSETVPLTSDDYSSPSNYYGHASTPSPLYNYGVGVSTTTATEAEATSSTTSASQSSYYGHPSLQYRHHSTTTSTTLSTDQREPQQRALSSPSANLRTATSPMYSYTYSASTSSSNPTSPTSPSSSSGSSFQKLPYPHALLTWVCLTMDVTILLILYPSLLPALLIVGLILYSLDLANLGGGGGSTAGNGLLTTAVGLSVLVLSILQGATVASSTASSSSSTMDASFVEVILMSCLAAILWISVAYHLALVLSLTRTSGSSTTQTAPSTTVLCRQLQNQLAGLVPLLTACFITRGLALVTATASSAVALPLAFGGVLALLSHLYHSTSSSPSTPSSPTETTAKVAAVPWIHPAVLVLTPLSMHLASCANRLLSKYVAMDDVYELILVATLPLLVACMWSSSSMTNKRLFFSPRTTQLVAIPLLSLSAFISFQQRYLLSVAHAFSYHFMGQQQSVWASTLYGILAVVSTLFSAALWSGQLLLNLGEYQEDAVQLGLALAGLAVGKLFGLPWNFTPLPILAFLGLTLWIATRMLRYLCIFLFVLHATGMVVFTYRFAGIDNSVNVVGLIQLPLIRFGFLVVFTSVLVGLIVGLAIRPSGGIGNRFLKRMQLVGILMTLYSLLLMALEITLLKRAVPTNELAGVELDSDDILEASTLYQHSYAIGTAAILLIVAVFMRRVRIFGPASALMVISVNVGKAVCLYMDAVSFSDDDDDGTGFKLFVRSLVAAFLVIVMFAPQVLLEPLHSKVRRRRSSLTAPDLPTESRRVTYLYAFVILPMALIAAMPLVLFPLAAVLAETYQNGFYATATYTSASLPILELLASTVALWGLACLSMLNHYLPDEMTGQEFKKIAAFAFLIGTLLFLISPLLGSGISTKALSSNPYAAMSSLGSQLMRGGMSRTGGWGLLAAALATLLALSGPLELRERRVVAVSGQSKKDRYLLLRTMVFSLLFGGGVAWFIVLTNLPDVALGTLIFLGLSCLSIACMGTVAAVLGYFLDLEAFDDAEQVIQACMFLTAVLLPVSGFSTFFTPSSHWFGADGWLSTFLLVVSITYLAIAISLRIRPTKNAKTSGVANTMGLASWVAALTILYGRYGVSGLDANYDMRLVLGLPASIIGTLILSPMLLVLEGEASALRRSAIKRLTGKAVGGGSSSLGIQLSLLRPSNRWFPLYFGSMLAFLFASLYAIFLRGSGVFRFMGGSAVARSHKEVFTNVYGNDPHKEHDLASLAELAIAHSNALFASVKLAGSGFWTADSLMGPLLHLAGVLSILPSLYLLTRQAWFAKGAPLVSVIFALPLHAVPLLLCRGIPSLRFAALLSLVAGIWQALHIRRVDQESKMRI